MSEAPKRLVYLDVLRAVAILSVMFAHLPPEVGPFFGRVNIYGVRGVDLFFVLSGFLIGTTSLARAELPVTVTQKFKTFWALRLARIWPLYFGLLGCYLVFSPHLRDLLVHHPLPYLTFTSNYFGQDTVELGVLWSLALEEQFYLVVGILVGVASMRRETLAAAFFSVALMAVVIAVRYRFEIADLHEHEGLRPELAMSRTYTSTLGRMDELGLGVLAAVAGRFVRDRVHLRSPWAAWAAVVLAFATMIYFPQPVGFEQTVIGLGCGVAVLVTQLPTLQLPASRVAKAIVIGIAHIGKVSFGLYLFHPFLRNWLFPYFKQRGWASNGVDACVFFVTWLATGLFVSSVSYHFLESPILRRARRMRVTGVRESTLNAA